MRTRHPSSPEEVMHRFPQGGGCDWAARLYLKVVRQPRLVVKPTPAKSVLWIRVLNTWGEGHDSTADHRRLGRTTERWQCAVLLERIGVHVVTSEAQVELRDFAWASST